MDNLKINLCSGLVRVDGYINIDICGDPDILIDLEEKLLPFAVNSVDVVVCMSAINYFTRARAREIIGDVFRALKPGGVTRFGVQDLRALTRWYLFHKISCDEFNDYFYGFDSGKGKHCKYVYDYITLEALFKECGFVQVMEMIYQHSTIPEADELDNRPDQMFYLEAVK